jgi:hypothetical protein
VPDGDATLAEEGYLGLELPRRVYRVATDAHDVEAPPLVEAERGDVVVLADGARSGSV